MNKFFSIEKKLLQKEISQVVKSAQKSAGSEYPWSKDALKRFESFTIPGKMIRGLLVILAAGGKTKSMERDAVRVGAALEMMHSGILIHDDIMDRDSLRRGLPTMFTQYNQLSSLSSVGESLHYGQGMATCVGIIAYFLAMGQFSKVSNKKPVPNLLNLFSSEMSLLGLGQMDDFHTGLIGSSSESSSLRIYQQKTGRYTFGLPILAGLYLAGNTSKIVVKQVEHLAKSLGIIFQLRDDYLGVFGDKKITGKSVGGDIRERKKTWLYFKLIKLANTKEKIKLQRLYNSHSVIGKFDQNWIVELMNTYNISKLVDSELRSQQKISLDLLNKLPFNKQQKAVMIDLIDYLIIREK